MKTNRTLRWSDALFLLGSLALFVGCIASSHRTARTLEPGRLSTSVSYSQVNNLEDMSEKSIHLAGVDIRRGLARGIDLGFEHTWDVSENHNGAYSSVWGDVKFQLTNRENDIGYPILSVGLLKGYAYRRGKAHFTGLPLFLSMRASDRITASLFYRHEYLSKNFIPSEFRDPRMTFGGGVEFAFADEVKGSLVPKLGIAVSTFNSLGGGKGENGLVVSVGVSVDSPLRRK